jgi:F-type H+-transporting ATPase subunit a
MTFLAMLQEGAHGAVDMTETSPHEGAAVGGGAEHAVSPIVEWINHAIGPATVPLQKAVMAPIYHAFGGEWHAPRAGEEIPAHVIFSVVAFAIIVGGALLLRGGLSVDKPKTGQQLLEVVVEQIRGMLDEVVGPYGRRYLAVIGTFAIFILIANLMGLFPLLDSPTGNFNVPLGLGICSFLYYFGTGFRQQGIGYLKHFTAGLSGWLAPMGALIFIVEILSNTVRPVTLGVRLFLNMFADHTIGGIFNGLAPFTKWIFPLLLPIPLACFVAFVQMLVFVMLSMVYLSETVPHEEHDHDEHGDGHASHAEHVAAHAH